MKKNAFLSILLLTLLACQSNSKKSLDANIKDSLKKVIVNVKKDSITTIKIEKNKLNDALNDLLGIWIVSTSKSGNASFALEKDSIFYPETNGRYNYKIYGDSIKIKYDEYIQSLHFKLKGKDTLFLKGDNEDHVYYRVKK